MAIKAVVFDFDGTLMDTETCAYDAYCGIYAEYGLRFPLEAWAAGIGTKGYVYDPFAELERLTGAPVDRNAMNARYQEAHAANVERATLFPGVLERLEEARRLGLSIGLASSSDRAWIERHLGRQGIRDYFRTVRTCDDVERVKPDPALYRLAIGDLGVEPQEAFAIEDSFNGLRAAKAAGLYGVAIPNTVTAKMDFAEADLILKSLEQQSLEDIIRLLEQDK
ncbi:HAD family hydrolase [Cohnella cholangitidis]|uniref:HAD-IA family hydrolase n=1 Tax=Cohnella cholangitidis TaxID=2598458 RepID=A0A7G5C1R3_9BACL|nr:HAD-IA family hydrolase [Cohnella cholangitidis]QMV43147.1 HAD-IA family hydrolase [Cohnella cholangitidis]